VARYEYYNDDNDDLPPPPDDREGWVWDDETGGWEYEGDEPAEDAPASADVDDDLPDWYFDLDSQSDEFWESFEDADFEYEVFEIGIDYGEDT
jgi:hypothetical protein